MCCLVRIDDRNLVNQAVLLVSSTLFLAIIDMFFPRWACAQSEIKRISPVLECVERLSCTPNGEAPSYLARFGYLNRNDNSTEVPIGSYNLFASGPQDRGQPMSFLPGRQQNVFTIPFTSGALVWRIDADGAGGSGASTATASTVFTQRCGPEAMISTSEPGEISVTCDDLTADLIGVNSQDNGGCGLTYIWSSTCEGAEIEDVTAQNTTIQFPSRESGTTCLVRLEVFQSEEPATSSVKADSYTINVTLPSCPSIPEVIPEQTPTPPPVLEPNAKPEPVDDKDTTVKIDVCGVTGGDGTSCLDCNGTPFGTGSLDECGVCNGDGLSCVDCKNHNYQALQLKLDGVGAQLHRTSEQLARQLLQTKRERRTYKGRIHKLLTVSAHSYHNLWRTAWSFPSFITSCETTSQACSAISMASTATNYTKQLNKLFRTVKKLWRHAQSEGLRARSRLLQARRARSRGLSGIKTVPESLVICDGASPDRFFVAGDVSP